MKITDLIKVPTLEDVKASCFSYCKAMGLPIFSWSPFSLPRAIVEFESQQSLECQTAIANIAKMGVLLHAEKEYLDLHAESNYQLFRNPAIQSERTIAVSNSLGTVRTWATGAFVITSKTDNKITYRNVSAIELPANGQVSVVVKNDIAGEDLTPGYSLVLSSTFPGVSIAPTSEFVLLGAAEESDDRLRRRCQLQWAKLSPAGSRASYEAWAMEIPEVTRFGCRENKNVSGSSISDMDVEIYVANNAGFMSPLGLANVQDIIELHRPLGIRCSVMKPTARNVRLAGAVKCKRGFAISVQGAAQKALNNYFSNLQLGETIYYSKIIGIVESIPGVIQAALLDADTGAYLTSNGKISMPPSQIAILKTGIRFDEASS